MIAVEEKMSCEEKVANRQILFLLKEELSPTLRILNTWKIKFRK